MHIHIKITSGVPDLVCELFNARKNYTNPNFGNHAALTVTIEPSADYVERYGKWSENWRGYSEFLADCFKYPLRVTEIDGSKVNIDPFKEEYKINMNRGERSILVTIEDVTK